jgi:hypothetical protein
MKSAVLWYTGPCSPLKANVSEEPILSILWVEKIKQGTSVKALSPICCSAYYILISETMFLRNVGQLSIDYMALYTGCFKNSVAMIFQMFRKFFVTPVTQ